MNLCLVHQREVRMNDDKIDHLQAALKAYLDMIKKEPVPDDIQRLAIKLDQLLKSKKTK